MDGNNRGKIEVNLCETHKKQDMGRDPTGPIFLFDGSIPSCSSGRWPG